MSAPSVSCERCHTPLPVDASFCPACGAATPVGAEGSTTRRDDTDQDLRQTLESALAHHYRIERELGRGGMALVYLAEDLRHKRRVALKALLPDVAALLGPDRFLREIEITAQLQHPNIVPVHDSGNANGTLYYVMPFIEGESLRDRLKRSAQLPLADVVQLVREVADALRYAHERGVIHRDIKPENILLSAGHAQVADFGIARAVRVAGGSSLTRTGGVLGTPAYMAPEQAAGLPDVDGRADLYALAAVAHECLAGSRATPMASSRSSERILVSGRPDLGPKLARALSAPLAVERDLRPSTAQDWLTMLAAAERRPRSPRIIALTAVGVAALAIVVGWWVRGIQVAPTDTVEGRRIAVFPAVTSGTSDPTLAATLTSAFEQQLLVLPGAELVSDSTEATEFVRVYATVSSDSQVALDVQVSAPSGRALRTARSTGRADSVPRIVAAVLGDVYAAQIATEQIGWSPRLPRRTDTWLDYTQGEQHLRSGDYMEAARHFERVIEREPSYAPAHFKRMLTEVLRSRPTRATVEVERALVAARAFRDSLDATTRDMLAGYDILMSRGDLDSALSLFAAITDRNPRAIDAWFILGYLKVNLAGLLRQSPIAARIDFDRAYELDRHYAAVLAQLARIAILRDNQPLAQSYTTEYLALDSVSPVAEVLRMADSAFGSVGMRVKLLTTLDSRPAPVLEYVALGAGAVDQPFEDRRAAEVAAEALWERATTPTERAVALRLFMALRLGSAQYASADTLMRLARRTSVPRDELDAWLVLPAVTIHDSLGSESELESAARRLADRSTAPALWLAARWMRDRDPAGYRATLRRLETLLQAQADTVPLNWSLLLDLRAGDALMRGDTAAALALWRDATSRYSISDVTFGLVGSLWPIELDRARVAAALGDHDGVLHAAQRFRYMAGFVDQIAWPVVWLLAIEAHRAAGDALSAQQVVALVRPVFQEANGKGVAIYESVK